MRPNKNVVYLLLEMVKNIENEEVDQYWDNFDSLLDIHKKLAEDELRELE